MIEALFITIIGMGGVFSFLLLLVCAMYVLRWMCGKLNACNDLEKIAVVVAVAQRGK